MFEEQIRKLLAEKALLFYNGPGNPTAFRACVPHLQSALFRKLVIREGENVVAKTPFYLADFDRREIREVRPGERIRLYGLEDG